MEWLPIESAPMNYDAVWVSDGIDVELASRAWSIDGTKETWESREQWDADGCVDPVPFKPTHWMPRPLPPA